MGVVYEAYDRVWQQTVALKTLVRTDPSAIYRLKTEFRSLADVAHPSLVCLYELFIENDLCFFTMELIDGVNLIRYVRDSDDPATEATPSPSQAPGDQDQTLTLATAVDSSASMARLKRGAKLERLRLVLRQLAEGLCALHDANKLHRDIKPSNIMVTTSGRVVILDFGLTTELTSSALHTLKFAGTPAYMSPEQGLDGQLTRASDWYSVGVTLYQSLTGSLPFADSDIVQLMRMKQTLEVHLLRSAWTAYQRIWSRCVVICSAGTPSPARQVARCCNDWAPVPASRRAPSRSPARGGECPLSAATAT